MAGFTKDFVGDDGLLSYLKKLDQTPLLSRGRELGYLKQIADLRHKIFKECFRYLPFREVVAQELLRTIKTLPDIIPPNPPISRRSWGAVGCYIKDVQEVSSSLVGSDKALRLEATRRVKCVGNVSFSILKTTNDLIQHLFCWKYLEEASIFFGTDMGDFKQLFTLSRRCLVSPQLFQVLKERVERVRGEISDMDAYLRDIDSISKFTPPVWSKSKQHKLCAISDIISTVNSDILPIRNILVESNLRLVLARAKLKVGRGMSFYDLIQAGNIGLMKSLDKYDLSLNTKLATYATWWIDLAIQRELENKSNIIKVPSHIQWLVGRIKNLQASQQYEDLSNSELAERLGVSEEMVKISVGIRTSPTSLEYELEDGTNVLRDLKQQDDSQDPFNVTATKMLGERVREVLSQLDPETEMILRMKFGIGELPWSSYLCGGC